jgi:hypothetical protein
MSVKHSSSSSKGKHIPTPPPLPAMRSQVKTWKTPTLKNKSQSYHSGATIAKDGRGRVVWLKNLETGKIIFNQNDPIPLSTAEIKAIEKKNASLLGIKYGGKRRKSKRTRRHKRY